MRLGFSFEPSMSIYVLLIIAAVTMIVILLVYRRFPMHLIYKSKINLQSMLDAVDEPLAVISEDFRVKRVNKAYTAMTGRTFKASIGAFCYALLRNRTSPCDDCKLNNTIKLAIVQRIDFSPHPDGAGNISITFSPYEMPYCNSTEVCIIEHIRDITMLENLKNNLEHKNRFLNAIVGKLRTMRRNTVADLKIARQIQLGLLPSQIPQIKEMRLDVTYQPITEVGGDIYDFFQINGNKLGIFIGDASGHGFSAALIATLSKMSLYHHTNNTCSTSELMVRMNQDLTANIHSSNYLTCFWGIFDFEEGKFTYSKAGHPIQLVLRKDGTLHKLDAEGTLLGIMENVDFEQKVFEFESGDRFFLFTDGIYDAVRENRNEGNAILDYEQFMLFIRQTSDEPFEEQIQTIKKKLTNFKHEDDYTLIITEICGHSECKSTAVTVQNTDSAEEISS
ncbi:MAG: SpoIIE family protein phosphatase [Chitinispirillales bacterium]|jgi:serine phosphatase RsbU (regulator of sigma subunit)|nr:SpoIIE family protein phosphatase [Chitinispirillales bacterium]